MGSNSSSPPSPSSSSSPLFFLGPFFFLSRWRCLRFRWYSRCCSMWYLHRTFPGTAFPEHWAHSPFDIFAFLALLLRLFCSLLQRSHRVEVPPSMGLPHMMHWFCSLRILRSSLVPTHWGFLDSGFLVFLVSEDQPEAVGCGYGRYQTLP